MLYNLIIRISFVSVFLLIFIQSRLLIQTKIKKHYSSSDCIGVKLNDYNYSSIISLDLNSSFTWIFDKGNDKDTLSDQSIICNNINIYCRGYDLYGKEVKTTISFSESINQSVSLQFYSIMSSVPGMHGSFSLGRIFTNNKYSIVHQYYSKGYCDHLAFALIKEYNNQSLLLGGIPLNYTEGRYHSSCNALTNQTNWSCYLSSIKIQTSERQFESKVNTIFYFNNVDWFTYCPSSFMDNLIDNFFKEDFGNRNCFLLESKPKRVIVCNNMQTNKRGNITFTIGDFVYTQSFEDYWICGEELCRFGFRESLDGNQFAFGGVFYQKYNMLFDYETNKISFYSFQSIEKLGFGDKGVLVKGILIGVVVNLMIGLAALSIVLINNTK